MIRIKIKLFATFREYLPDNSTSNEISIELEEPAKIGEVLSGLKIPSDQEMIIMVNSTHAKKDRTLENGDVLALFPPIAGG